jgi:hypothetical protein
MENLSNLLWISPSRTKSQRAIVRRRHYSNNPVHLKVEALQPKWSSALCFVPSASRTEARIATARGRSVTVSFPGERSERENRGCPLDSQLFVYTIICKEGSDEC